MAASDVETLRSGYEAFNRADIPAVLNLFDPAIEWQEPGGGDAPRGTFRGSESVGRDVFAAVPQYFAEFRAEPERFIDAGEHVAVVGRFRGRSKGGRALDAPFVHVWTMRDGKAARFYNHVEAAPWASAWDS